MAAHTHGDILLGYLCNESDAEQPFEGVLHRPVEAYERIHDYYVGLRANHGDLMLRIDNPPEPMQWLPAVTAPQMNTDQTQLEDYILETL